MTDFLSSSQPPDPDPLLFDPSRVKPPQIFVAAAAPGPQQRVTVFFRLLLLVPHFIVLYILLLVSGLIAFLGWWGALFTGWLPRFAYRYQSGFLHWLARAIAYGLLLTDAYPPFTLEDDVFYPVRVAIPERQRLNRGAVFFRLILVIPANLLGTVVSYGYCTASIVAWVIVLIRGKMPAGLHLAFLGGLRFCIRLYGYSLMLTAAYPGGLYGDKPGSTAWADGPADARPPAADTPQQPYDDPAYGAPQGYGAPPGYGAPGYGAPQGYGAPGYGAYGVPGYGAYGAPGYARRPAFLPATWLLTLTSMAKRLITVFIVLGMVTYGAILYIDLSGLPALRNLQNFMPVLVANGQLSIADSQLSAKMTVIDQAMSKCNGAWQCLAEQDGKAAAANRAYYHQLMAITVPASASPAMSQLRVDTETVIQDFTQLNETSSASDYTAMRNTMSLDQALNQVNQDTTNLSQQLVNAV